MFSYSPIVPRTVVQRNSLGINPYEGFNPSPLNYTTKYRHTSTAESKQYQSFQDALTVCFVCGLVPEQAVKEFKDEFKKSPPPIYFQWWQGCWDEFEITPAKVSAWLIAVDRDGWIERLGGAA
jgi:hypothetical protein